MGTSLYLHLRGQWVVMHLCQKVKRIPRTKNISLIPITQVHGRDHEVVYSSLRVSMTLVTSMSRIRPLDMAVTRMSYSFSRFIGWTAACRNIFSSKICSIPSILGSTMWILNNVKKSSLGNAVVIWSLQHVYSMKTNSTEFLFLLVTRGNWMQ